MHLPANGNLIGIAQSAVIAPATSRQGIIHIRLVCRNCQKMYTVYCLGILDIAMWNERESIFEFTLSSKKFGVLQLS